MQLPQVSLDAAVRKHRNSSLEPRDRANQGCRHLSLIPHKSLPIGGLVFGSTYLSWAVGLPPICVSEQIDCLTFVFLRFGMRGNHRAIMWKRSDTLSHGTLPRLRVSLANSNSRFQRTVSSGLVGSEMRGRNSVSDPIPFPSPASSDDEKLARLKAKAEALADKPEFEVKFFLAKHAADVGVSPEQLEAAVAEVRKLRRKDAQARTDREKAEARKARRRESKEKSRASLFRRLKGLPDVRRRTESEQWCRQWSEDTEVVAVEFIEYAREGAPLRPAISEEMAADPVNGPDLVEMILRRIRQYCVLTPEVETAGAFWLLLTFVPAEIALNAPIFTVYGPKHDAG